MLEAVTLLGLLNTGAKVAGAIVEGVGNAIGGENSGSILNGQNFSSLLSSTQTGASLSLNTKSSLDITKQGEINNITLPASNLINTQPTEEISDATLEALNNILSGNSETENLEVLSEDNLEFAENDEAANNSGGILGNTKLNDPFGIEAAKANGSPIAVASASIIPAESLPNNVNAETGEILVSNDLVNKNNSSLNTNTENQNKALPNNLILQNAKSENANVAEGEIEAKLATENLNSKDLKVSDNKSNSANALADKPNDKIIHNHNSAFYGAVINKDENRAIGDYARAVRSKNSLEERIAEIDSYKVVNVSRKDNILDLRLEPAALGKVQIKFDFAADGKTNVMVIADRQETLDMMKRDTDSIQKLLSDNGVKAESGSLSFNLRGGGQQNNDNFNFFSGKPISFGVQEEINKLAANDDLKSANLNGYGIYAGTGLLNIMV